MYAYGIEFKIIITLGHSNKCHHGADGHQDSLLPLPFKVYVDHNRLLFRVYGLKQIEYDL